MFVLQTSIVQLDDLWLISCYTDEVAVLERRPLVLNSRQESKISVDKGSRNKFPALWKADGNAGV